MTRFLVLFEGADVLVCESTYGNRRHPAVDVEAELAQSCAASPSARAC